jgi:hypothetical protein
MAIQEHLHPVDITHAENLFLHLSDIPGGHKLLLTEEEVQKSGLFPKECPWTSVEVSLSPEATTHWLSEEGNMKKVCGSRSIDVTVFRPPRFQTDTSTIVLHIATDPLGDTGSYRIRKVQAEAIAPGVKQELLYQDGEISAIEHLENATSVTILEGKQLLALQNTINGVINDVVLPSVTHFK